MGWSMNQNFTVQKHCIRVLFGDRESYLAEFKTCARVRPRGSEKLGAEFYSREDTKPIFAEYNLLAVRNLYHYFCTVEVFKILKFRQPITLYELYRLSQRETALALILPERSGQFFYESALTTKILHFKD